jgi:hypothetical protein
MKKELIAIIVTTLLATAVGAQSPGTTTFEQIPKGKVLSSSSVEVTATVTAINQETREVTFKRQDGTVRTVVAGPEVKNLAQVKVGDTIKLQYQEAVSIRIDKSTGGTPAIKETVGVSRNAPGSLPGGYIGKETTKTALVEAINAIDSVVTLKGPEGRLLDVFVEDRATFGKVNIGDTVVITYSEAVALTVERTPAK